MESLEILTDLFLVFLVSGLVVYALHWLRIPVVVALMTAGAVMGPFGFSLVHDLERVELLAEIGVVVLLFTVGLEFSISRLWSMWPLMLKVGLSQVLLSGVAAGLVTIWFESWATAVFVGMLVSMSSTAIVLKVLADRGELSAPQGRVAVAVLIFQDLLVVLFMLLVPLLARQDDVVPIWWVLLRGIGVLVGILVLARYAVPPLVDQVLRTRNRELFIILLMVLCLGTALVTASIGLSLALGAFLAGLALSESEYAYQTLAEAIPFRDMLASLFFVSIGMLLDLNFVLSNWLLVSGIVVGIFTVKTVAAALPTCLSGFAPRVALLSGVAVAQVGEFSFLLADRGRETGLLSPELFQLILAAAVLTIALTPPLISLMTNLAGRWARLQENSSSAEDSATGYREHVIICGYGVSGRNLARTLRGANIPYVVMELNPETVRRYHQQGEHIVYGDCSRPALLEHLGIHAARLLVVAISDPLSVRAVIYLARKLNSKIHIIARTRFTSELKELEALGADQVIPEEFETAVEIVARVLREYAVPSNIRSEWIQRIRSDHYEMLRNGGDTSSLSDTLRVLRDKIQLESCLLRPGSATIGITLRDLALRQISGASLVAVRRGSDLLLDLSPETRFEEGDVLIVVGGPLEVARALMALEPAHSVSHDPLGHEPPPPRKSPSSL